METPKNKDFLNLVSVHLQEQELPIKSDFFIMGVT